MQIIEAVYSPLCEATGAMIGKLRQWLEGTDVQIRLFSFDHCPQRLKSKFKKGENCFIDIFYCENRIDSVPLHCDRIYESLGIQASVKQKIDKEVMTFPAITSMQLNNAFRSGEISPSDQPGELHGRNDNVPV